MCGCVQVYAGMRGMNFQNTSADFDTYPIRILSMFFAVKKSLDCRVLIEIVLAVICKNLCQ